MVLIPEIHANAPHAQYVARKGKLMHGIMPILYKR